MLIFAPVCLEQLSILGKKYNWQRPTECPSCIIGRVWGHGYVATLFEGFVSSLWLKRWRCAGCKTVITVRPDKFFSRFQSPTEIIFSVLRLRIQSARWPPKLPRQRAGQWLRRFVVFIKIQYGEANEGHDLVKRLRDLFERGVKFMASLK